jgi:SPX domain protein involved in polyphosphate accumulation
MNKETTLREYRHERKFQLSGISSSQVESVIRQHPALFSEIYYSRYINNIYCESSDMKGYFDNVNGLFKRAKVRIRWYGDLFGHIKKPILELKIKKGSLGTKEFYPLESFTIEEGFNTRLISDIFERSNIPEALRLKLRTVRPFLLNRYKRKYFQSADKNYRITIDTDLRYFGVDKFNNTFLHQSIDSCNIILELKYAKARDDILDTIKNTFPFRLSRNSKYVSAVHRLYV